MSDAIDFVRKHKQKADKDKPSRKRARVSSSSREYTSADLDVKVAQDIGEFDAGTDHILTLKDQTILDDKGNELADSEDVLENVALREKEELKKRLEDKAKLSKYKSRGVAYDIFEESTVVLDDGTIERKMLPQYDETQQSGGFKLKKGSALDSTVVEKQRAVIRARLSKVGGNDADTAMTISAAPGAQVYDLSAPIQLPATDYLTSNEALATFKSKKGKSKKGKGKGKKGKGKKKIRKVGAGDDVDEGRVEQAEDAGDTDIKFDDDDDDDELALHLARAREEALKERQRAREEKEKEKEESDAVLQRAAAIASLKASKKSKTIGGAGDTLVISETTEFIRQVADAEVQQAQAEERKKYSTLRERQLARDLEEQKEREREEDRKQRRIAEVESVDMDIDQGKGKGKGKESDGEGEDGAAVLVNADESSVATGVGGALALFRMQGNLHDDIELAGRNRDSRVYYDGAASAGGTGAETKDERARGERDRDRGDTSESEYKMYMEKFSGVRLDYIDEFGRNMTAKEAFRHISHVFHGQEPGKNAKARRQKQYEDEVRRKEQLSGEAVLRTAAKMQMIQEQTQQPFIMLKGKTHEEKIAESLNLNRK